MKHLKHDFYLNFYNEEVSYFTLFTDYCPPRFCYYNNKYQDNIPCGNDINNFIYNNIKQDVQAA